MERYVLNASIGEGMKLHDKRYQWMYDHCNELKRALVTMDYLKQQNIGYSNEGYKKASDKAHHLAFSFLMVIMGEHIPKSLWSVNDYSVLYGILDDHKDELEIMNDN